MSFIFNYLASYLATMLLLAFRGRYGILNLTLSVLVVSYLVGFRSIDVGIDTHTYYLYYEQVLLGIKGTWMEAKVGYVFYYLSLFADYIGGDASYLTFMYALLTCSLIFYTVFKHSVSPLVSIAYFFTGIGLFFYMHNVMRQALAIAIVFSSMPFIYKKEMYKLAASTALAVLVHASAIVVVPVYFIVTRKINSLYFLIAWLISLPFIFVPSLIIFIAEKLYFAMPSVYVHYLQSQSMYDGGGLSGFGLVFLLKQLFFLLIFLAYKKDLSNAKNRTIYLLALIGIVLGNFVLGLGLMARFVDYFLIFIMLALPLSINALVIKKQRLIVHFFFLAMFAILFFQALLNGAQGVAAG